MPLAKPITPHLWFDSQAREAAEFYCSVFPESRIDHVGEIRDTPSGTCEIVSFSVRGQDFMAISAGPYFTPNPSVSFFVNFDPSRDARARENLDALWERLSPGGTALMPLDTYPWSQRYGWVQDRFGVSWQLILTDAEGDPRPPIVPSLLFTGPAYGRAEEAMRFYMSVFEGSQEGVVARYPAGQEPHREGTLMYGDFRLAGTWFAAMDGAGEHPFRFSEGISFMVRCRDQAEIDYYWERLSAVPEAEQCGWCKDRFGLSWQIAPLALDAVMRSGDPDRIARVTQAFLPMKKFDVAAIEAAAASPAHPAPHPGPLPPSGERE
jgi:predicted 3-demethylubiquinone-9 3-methyltransferase (glyoxalase superfamily)